MPIKSAGILFFAYNEGKEGLAAMAQPLSVLAVTNVLGVAVTLLQMLRTYPRDERSFARAALVLLACLDVFAFLSGFSIGGLVALATVPVGILLWLLAKHYRAQIAFATTVNLLMFLSTGVHIALAAWAYKALPAALMAVGAAGLVRQRADPQRAPEYAFALVAGLAFQALLTDSAATPALAGGARGGWLGLAALGLALGLGLAFRRFRWEFLLVGWVSLLWVLNVALQG